MTDLFLNVDIVEDKNDQSPFSNIFEFLASHFISQARSAMAKEINLISGWDFPIQISVFPEPD